MVRLPDLLNSRKPSISEVYELIREIHFKTETFVGENVRRFDELGEGLSEQGRQRETVVEGLRDEISNLGDALGTRIQALETDLKAAFDALTLVYGAGVETLGGGSVSLAAGAASRLDYFRDQFDVMNAFLRWARADDRRQMDAIGTIAKRTEEFVRFARADDRAQLDQVGILADNVHKGMASMLGRHEEAFRTLGQAAETLNDKLVRLDHKLEDMDRKVGSLCRSPGAEADAALGLDPISRRGLFVVGHARAGTSILQAALNTSPDVFLFGEANFHFHALNANFRDWYNRLHTMFGAPHLKSSYCPALLPEAATGLEYLQSLAANYRWVGEKVAFGASSEDFGFNSFSNFHERRFYDAHYVCIIKHPFSTLISNKTMFKALDMRPHVRSFIKTLAKIVEVNSIHPNVRVLVHEQITAKTFEKLSDFLSIPLDEAFSCYVQGKQGHVEREAAERVLGEEHCAMVERAWLRFLEFYDPQALVIREREGRMSYLLTEYAEMVAAIDQSVADSLAAERRDAEAARLLEARAQAAAKSLAKAAKAKSNVVKTPARSPVQAVAEASPSAKTKRPAPTRRAVAKAPAPRATRTPRGPNVTP